MSNVCDMATDFFLIKAAPNIAGGTQVEISSNRVIQRAQTDYDLECSQVSSCGSQAISFKLSKNTFLSIPNYGASSTRGHTQLYYYYYYYYPYVSPTMLSVSFHWGSDDSSFYNIFVRTTVFELKML